MDWRALVPGLRSGPLLWLLALAAAGFGATAWLADPARLPGLCGAFSAAALADTALLVAQLSSPAALALAWSAMLVAMMPPLLVQPVAHVWHSSPHARRAPALALFGLGYSAVWLAAGAVLIPVAIGLRLVVPGAAVGLVALAAALVWSCSPAAQAARNRCHRLLRIGAFGRAADRDCLRQGLASGAACAAACWPWMLVPITVAGGHLAAMAAVTLVLLAERVTPPVRTVWRLPPAFLVLAALRRPQKVVGTW